MEAAASIISSFSLAFFILIPFPDSPILTPPPLLSLSRSRSHHDETYVIDISAN